MAKLSQLLDRFPDREFDIHWLYHREAEFRSFCDDYEDAARALRYWQSTGNAEAWKASDYQHLMSELEAEILACLTSFANNR